MKSVQDGCPAVRLLSQQKETGNKPIRNVDGLILKDANAIVMLQVLGMIPGVST